MPVSEKFKFLNKARLVKELKAAGVKNAQQTANEALSSRETNQVRRQIRGAKGRPFRIVGGPGLYQTDCAFLPQYRLQNAGKTSFLLVINVPTRRAYARPLKNQSASELLRVFEKLQPLLDPPCTALTGDNHFASKAFTDYCTDRNIDLHTDIAALDHISKFGDRLGIADRTCRTIKGLIDKYIDQEDDLQWTKYLPDIMEVYNDSPHAALKAVEPGNVTLEQAEALQRPKRRQNAQLYNKQTVEPGQTVRIYEGTGGQFAKGEVRFSRQLFTVKERDGYKWRVTDSEGKVLKRKFRDYELLKVDKGKLVTFKGGTNKEAAVKVHKHAQRLVRSTGASTSQAYEQAQEAADKANRKAGGLEETVKRSGRAKPRQNYAQLAKGN